MRRTLLALAALLPFGGCSVMMATLGRPENMECKDYAYSSIVDIVIGAVGAGIIYAEDGGRNAYIGDSVFGASAMVGVGAAIVCDARKQAHESPRVYYPQGSSTPPESVKLDPASDDGPRDATPEEMGLGRVPPTVDLTVTSPPPVAPKPAVEAPPAFPLPTCQIESRIDCPIKTRCVLQQENKGVCQPID